MDSMDFGTAGLGFFKLHRRFGLIASRILDLDSFSSDGSSIIIKISSSS